jgi:predicted O-methyltransferase YrrM
MVKDDSLVIHKKITIVRNLRDFISAVQNDEELESELLDTEDGVLIFTKK